MSEVRYRIHYETKNQETGKQFESIKASVLWILVAVITYLCMRYVLKGLFELDRNDFSGNNVYSFLKYLLGMIIIGVGVSVANSHV